jgi:hypothetical protein
MGGTELRDAEAVPSWLSMAISLLHTDCERRLTSLCLRPMWRLISRPSLIFRPFATARY